MRNPTTIDTVLLVEVKGATKKDKIVFFCIKNIYRGLTVLSRIVVGKKKGDQPYNQRRISFMGFLYKSIEFLGLDDSFSLVFDVPEYDYKFYSLVTKKIPNFSIQDMSASMTIHEKDVRKRFNPKEGDVVIDVGAAFGLYTLPSSKQVGQSGKVIAIEAHPKNYEMLNRNVKLNNLTNVTCLNYAVYSTKTKVKIYSNYTIMSERVSGKGEEKAKEVNADTLDNILEQSGIAAEQVNWIKIDVEGAELEVLKGAHNILSNSKDIAISIEIHGQNKYQPVIDLLNSYNLRVIFQKNYDWGDSHVIARR
jgi:FkbM family methyltransferase